MLAALLSLWFAAATVVIELHGPVDQAMAEHVRSALERAQERKAAVVVLDVDTWGGELEAAFEISDAVSSARNCSTVAFVRRKAISAGALIALSAQQVWMAPGATMGDCAPIIPTAQGPQFLGEKIESPLRARFRALAKRHGIPDLLAEKMVSKDLEVVQAVDSAGRRDYYTTKNFGELVGEKRQSYVSWKILVADGQLLTVDDREAKDLGFSRGTYPQLDSLLAARNWDAKADRMAPSWSLEFASWLAGLSPLLFMVGLALLWIEYKSPGGFVFGLTGFVVLGIALGSKYLLGLSDQIPLLLAAIGVLLFFLEVWILPGTVLPSLFGGACLLAALTMSLQGFSLPDPGDPAQMRTTLHSFGLVVGCLMAGLLLALVFVRLVLVRLPGRDGMHLKASLESGGAIATREEADLVGSLGRTQGALRPWGKIEVGGRIVDAYHADGYLPDGVAVRVSRRHGAGWDVERS